MEPTSTGSPRDEEARRPIYDGICGHARKALQQISSADRTYSVIQNEPGTDTYLLKQKQDIDISVREINRLRSQAENQCRAVVGNLKRDAVRNFAAWAMSDRAEKWPYARAIVPEIERFLESIEAEQRQQSSRQWVLIDAVFDLVCERAKSKWVQLKDTAAERMGLLQAIAVTKRFKRLRGYLEVVLVARPPLTEKTSPTARKRTKRLSREELVRRFEAVHGCWAEVEKYPDAKEAVLQFSKALRELIEDPKNFDIHRSGSGYQQYVPARAAYRQFADPMLRNESVSHLDQAPPLVRVLIEVYRLALVDGSTTPPAVAFSSVIRAYISKRHLDPRAQLPQRVDQMISDARRASTEICRLIGVTDFNGRAFVGRLYLLARFCCSLSYGSSENDYLARFGTYCAYLDLFVNRFTHLAKCQRSELETPLSERVSEVLLNQQELHFARELLLQALRILVEVKPPVIKDAGTRLRCYSEAETSSNHYPSSFDLRLLQ